MFYLVSGKISQYDISYRGDEIITNLFKPPAFFPMSVALNDSTNQFFYKAETESVVHIAPPREVVAFVKANPDVMFDLLRRVYRGVDGVLGRIVHLMAGTARSRLVYEIVVECRRFGEMSADEKSYVLGVNETQLAARTGLSRETVSREMKQLKDIGAIRIKPHEIDVIDLAKLKAILGAVV